MRIPNTQSILQTSTYEFQKLGLPNSGQRPSQPPPPFRERFGAWASKILICRRNAVSLNRSEAVPSPHHRLFGEHGNFTRKHRLHPAICLQSVRRQQIRLSSKIFRFADVRFNKIGLLLENFKRQHIFATRSKTQVITLTLSVRKWK